MTTTRQTPLIEATVEPTVIPAANTTTRRKTPLFRSPYVFKDRTSAVEQQIPNDVTSVACSPPPSSPRRSIMTDDCSAGERYLPQTPNLRELFTKKPQVEDHNDNDPIEFPRGDSGETSLYPSRQEIEDAPHYHPVSSMMTNTKQKDNEEEEAGDDDDSLVGLYTAVEATGVDPQYSGAEDHNDPVLRRHCHHGADWCGETEQDARQLLLQEKRTHQPQPSMILPCLPCCPRYAPPPPSSGSSTVFDLETPGDTNSKVTAEQEQPEPVFATLDAYASYRQDDAAAADDDAVEESADGWKQRRPSRRKCCRCGSGLFLCGSPPSPQVKDDDDGMFVCYISFPAKWWCCAGIALVVILLLLLLLLAIALFTVFVAIGENQQTLPNHPSYGSLAVRGQASSAGSGPSFTPSDFSYYAAPELVDTGIEKQQEQQYMIVSRDADDYKEE